jgi:pectinesterase
MWNRLTLLAVLLGLFGIASLVAAGGPDPMTVKPAFSDRATMKFALVGDSTVTDDAGWGLGFKQWLDGGAECINLARGGRSSKSFRDEGRWQQALELKPDYVLIQFGHNDEPGHGAERETDAATKYRENIARYVDEARAAGIKPILITPAARRQWKDGTIASSLAPYAASVRSVAKEKGVPFVDLHDRSIEFYQSLGQANFNLIAPPKEGGGLDGTHFNSDGGKAIGSIVAEDVRQAIPEIAQYLGNWRGGLTTTPTSGPTTALARVQSPEAIAATQAAASITSQGAKSFVVAADGSGDFRTVQEAIAAAPAGNADRTTIRIKPGVYHGPIIVPRSKPNLSFIGDDAATTILTYALNVRDPNPPQVPNSMAGYGVIVLGDGWRAENLTIRHTAGDRAQAIALRMQADRCVIRNCRLLGWQDTLRVHSKRQYFVDCYIEGRVDFIYGASVAVFENSELKSKNGGYVTAASTPQEEKYGYVFLNCRLTSDDNTPTYLGRPWRPYANVIFARCELGAHIKPEGWDNWGKAENEQTVKYAEYRCTGPGADRSKRVAWSRELSEAEGEVLSAKSVLAGNDGWDPTAP